MAKNTRKYSEFEIIRLILAKLNGEITPEDECMLRQWLMMPGKNRNLYDRIMSGQNFQEYLSLSGEHDYEFNYQKFLHRIKNKRRKFLFKRFRNIAAILLPFLFTIFWGISGEKKIREIANEKIIHGYSQAKLTLADGSMITLSEMSDTLCVDDGKLIVISDTLSYALSSEKGSQEYHILSVPRGGEYILKLSDGTKIWLNSESELKYPSYFTGNKRKVFLKGEAYFEVAKDTFCPFIVEAGCQSLKVLGTSFCVRAYTDEACVNTTLESGMVNVSMDTHSVKLVPGEQSRTGQNGIIVKKVNTFLYTAWRTGKFVFEDQALEEILSTLARWYNMDIFYASPDLKQIAFTGELIKYADIREILEKIEMLEKVRFEVKGRTVTVSGYSK